MGMTMVIQQAHQLGIDMNISLHQAMKGVAMTETTDTYQAGQADKKWRCPNPKCHHILGTVINGECTVIHTLRVSDKTVPVLICPVCKTEIKLYSYVVEGK